MKRIAFVFPGQGSQAVGMGRDLGEVSPRWKAASAALGFDLKTLVFEGPEADLRLTANTQPAILATSIVALDALTAGPAAAWWLRSATRARMPHRSTQPCRRARDTSRTSGTP